MLREGLEKIVGFSKKFLVGASFVAMLLSCSGGDKPQGKLERAKEPKVHIKGKIAFVSSREEDGIPRIYSFGPELSDVRLLTKALGGYSSPIFSHNGKQIAYTNWQNIYVMDSDGKNQKQLTSSGRDLDITWSRDDKRIAFQRDQYIFVIDSDGKNLQQLISEMKGASNPSWSPDGKKIAFQQWETGRVYEIFIINSNGVGKPENLTNTPYAWEQEPTFSPDGKKIAFARDGGDGYRDFDIYTLDISLRNEPKNLTNDFNKAVDCLSPGWSPDGSKILYYKSGEHHPVTLFVTDMNGSHHKELTLGWRARWSPDGNEIVFQSDHEGTKDIYITDLNGIVQRLTNDPAVDTMPHWGIYKN